MKHIALFMAASLLASPALAQSGGKVTLIVSPTPQQQIEGLDSTTLALQVRQMLDRGAMSGTSIPLVQDGANHEKRVRLGGDAAVYYNRNFSRTTVQGLQRDIVISYGPSRRGGLGLHAEVVDSSMTPRNDGTVERTEGPRSQITGVVPADGRPQAIMSQGRVEPNSIVLPSTLIVLVEP